MGWLARWNGTCPVCKQRITQWLDMIVYRNSADPTRKREYVHVSCATPAERSTPTPEPPEIPAGDFPASSPRQEEIEAMEKSDNLASLIADVVVPKVLAALPKGPDQKVIDAMVAEAVSKLERPVVVEFKREGHEPVKVAGQHKQFEDLAYHMASKWPVYVLGPHGSGKSEAAKLIAKTLNFGFGYCLVSPFTTESKFFGCMTLQGEVTKPDFRKCWENGGVFLADEFDNALPSLQVAIMSAIGSRDVCSFPDGTIPCHENFTFVATGNCNSWAPDPAYPGRHPFDRAFASRFKFIEWTYDNGFELDLARARWTERPLDVLSIVAWAQTVRDWAKINLPRFVPCPRETFKVVEDLAQNRPISKVLRECFFTGLPEEQGAKVLAAHPFPTLRGA